MTIVSKAHMEGADEEIPLIHHMLPRDEGSEYTSDGTVDINMKPALKQSTGNWRACFLILGAEFSECLCFFGVARNLVTYLTSVLHESNTDAARSVSTWIGSCFFAPIIGAFLADTYWGRYKTIVIALSVYAVGMVILTVSASLPFLMHPSHNGDNVDVRRVAVYLGLYLVALGTGGIKPCTTALGADQFDSADRVEKVTKGSFFNWYYFSINIGSLLSATVLVWVEDNIGWGVGFAIPTVLMGFGLAIFVTGRKVYRYKKLGESPLIRVSQVVVAAVRNYNLKLPSDSSALHEPPSAPEGDYKIQHTDQFRFLDKAAILSNQKGAGAEAGPWRLCGVSQVEELKMLLRTFPIWASMVLFFAVTAQMSSTLIEQGMAMDNRVGTFTVPPAALSTFDVVSVLICIPVYDAVLVPLARRITGKERGISQLQRIGVGLALSVVAMAYSALVEANRLDRSMEAPMNIMWQAPSYFMLGVAEVFTSIGMLEFFYDQSPDTMKSFGAAIAQLAIAAGNYLNSGVIGMVAAATTGGEKPGWIPDNLDEGHLDYFFWMMAGLSVLNMVQFFHCSMRYRGYTTLT